MKRALVLCSCCFLLGAGWVLGQQASGSRASQEAGPAWKAIPDEWRVWYVSGFMAGYNVGAIDGHVVTLASPKLGQTGQFRFLDDSYNSVGGVTTDTLQDARDRLAAMLVGPQTSSLGWTQRDLINQVSLFYQDFRNTPVCWHDAVVFSAESLAGHPPADGELNARRTAGAQFGCP